MTHLIKTPVKSLLIALSLSAASFAPALAQQDASFGPIPLPELSPAQIAGDVVREYDRQTGVQVMIAPTFDPFEADDSLAGTAALRTGASRVAIDGTAVSGGAYVDLSMIYTTGSDDPYDVRGFDRAVYVSGQEVTRISQDLQTLDCSENNTQIVYGEDYHRGSSYGYLAGLYVLLPRYRGHRGYGRSYGGRGYGYGHGYGFGTGRGYWGRGGRGRGGNSGGGGNGGGGNGSGSGNGGDNASTTKARITPITRPRDTAEGRRRIRDATGTTGRRGSGERRERINREDTQGRRGTSKRRISPVSRPRVDPDNGGNSRATTRQPRAPKPTLSAPVSRPVSRPDSRPAPVPRSELRSEPRARPQSKAKSNPVSKPVSRPKSRLSSPTSRGLKDSRSPSGRSPSSRGRKSMNFFPVQLGASYGGAYARSDVYSSFRCVREEKVTLHIPQDRLDAARFDGLTLVLLDRNGADVPVYLPANYIEGFRQAQQGYASSPQPQAGQQGSIPLGYGTYGYSPQPNPQSGTQPQQTQPQSQPQIQGQVFEPRYNYP